MSSARCVEDVAGRGAGDHGAAGEREAATKTKTGGIEGHEGRATNSENRKETLKGGPGLAEGRDGDRGGEGRDCGAGRDIGSSQGGWRIVQCRPSGWSTYIPGIFRSSVGTAIWLCQIKYTAARYIVFANVQLTAIMVTSRLPWGRRDVTTALFVPLNNMNPLSSPLFAAPMPWLHASSKSDAFNAGAAASTIASHFQVRVAVMPSDHLLPFMRAVETSNTWLTCPPDSEDMNDASNRTGVAQRAWKTELSSPVKPMNNTLRGYIPCLMLPLIFTDILLHVSKPDPAPVVERAPARSLQETSQVFLAKSNWVELLRECHRCYSRNIGNLSTAPDPRGADKKTALLKFWNNMRIENPLKNAIRNLALVALVLSLYMLASAVAGDVNFSREGRAAYLIHLHGPLIVVSRMATAQHICLTEAKVLSAVDSTDVGMMMGPSLVAISFTPLALLGPVSYLSKHFKSRIPLLDTWRDLGNRHRVVSDDPLGVLEHFLWHLIFRLARKEIVETDLLRMFYEHEIVKCMVSLEEAPVPPPGYGLSFVGDQMVNAVENVYEEVLEEVPEVHITLLLEDTVRRPPVKKRRTEAAVGKAAASGSSRGSAAASTSSATAAGDAAGGRSSKPVELRPRSSKGKTPAVSLRITVPPSRKTDSSRVNNKPRPSKCARSLSLRSLCSPRRSKETPEKMTPSLQKKRAILSGVWTHAVFTSSRLKNTHCVSSTDTPDDPSAPLVATKHEYLYWPLDSTKEEVPYLDKIVASQPLKLSEVLDEDVPLHVHPDAQMLHSSGATESADGKPLLPDLVPSDTVSIVYVVHEDNWARLTAEQRQGVLRIKAVLIIHRFPYCHDGRFIRFDEERFEELTHLDRHLGARKKHGPIDLQVGRPRDLLACRNMVEENIKNADSSGSRDKTQRLNMLSNTLPSKTLEMPAGWSDVATHEFACTWTKHLLDVPEFVFPWTEVNWAIFATSDAFTWIHCDVMFTVVTLPTGEKLWFLGRRRTDLLPDDLRGDMRSRFAFKTFNGWTDMTQVWVFERLHLSPYTTLYMAAGIPHCVASMTNCIGLGRHGVPASNLSHCVFFTLHNTVLSESMTNADHEPVRRFLIRIFIFVVLAFVDIRNGGTAAGGLGQRLTARMSAHLPDVTTCHGVLDLLALRSFVVLFLALNGTKYAYLVNGREKNVLPMDVETAWEMSLVWKLAHNIVEHITQTFVFETVSSSAPVGVWDPSSFSDAADLALVTMAASMYRYLKEVTSEEKKSLPMGFTAAAFKTQVVRILVMFNMHEDIDESWRKSHLFKDPAKEDLTSGSVLSREFPWDTSSLPFRLRCN
ncbi:hypothetical protein B0H14DRAFT_2585599 [Mycena olivaceomarginata]|nr:hypothetical protein B0H14DRAFT_2585599 [Mycena olivaceomarginata]